MLQCQRLIKSEFLAQGMKYCRECMLPRFMASSTSSVCGLGTSATASGDAAGGPRTKSSMRDDQASPRRAIHRQIKPPPGHFAALRQMLNRSPQQRQMPHAQVPASQRPASPQPQGPLEPSSPPALTAANAAVSPHRRAAKFFLDDRDLGRMDDDPGTMSRRHRPLAMTPSGRPNRSLLPMPIAYSNEISDERRFTAGSRFSPMDAADQPAPWYGADAGAPRGCGQVAGPPI